MDPFIEARQLARKLKAIDEATARKLADAEAKKLALLDGASAQARDLVAALLKIPDGTQALEPQAGEAE